MVALKEGLGNETLFRCLARVVRQKIGAVQKCLHAPVPGAVGIASFHECQHF
jgi:hypothetical protein